MCALARSPLHLVRRHSQTDREVSTTLTRHFINHVGSISVRLAWPTGRDMLEMYVYLAREEADCYYVWIWYYGVCGCFMLDCVLALLQRSWQLVSQKLRSVSLLIQIPTFTTTTYIYIYYIFSILLRAKLRLHRSHPALRRQDNMWPLGVRFTCSFIPGTR